MAGIEVRIQRLDSELLLPAYAYPGDAGLDLRAASALEIAPQQRALIPTGIKVAIPEGYAGFVQPRSGLAAKAGLTLVNTPGLIDSHYRGEIVVIALNTDLNQPIRIAKGDRIAQLVILPVPLVTLLEVPELDATERSEKGFGSSGL
ncbi:MAG: dUTP diphosphatase [Coriobacteriales bacterium]|jgi:dUTP pyrophosphatase|nr:dUTP diphosphatase [Coriobacteriales bacterium]